MKNMKLHSGANTDLPTVSAPTIDMLTCVADLPSSELNQFTLDMLKSWHTFSISGTTPISKTKGFHKAYALHYPDAHGVLNLNSPFVEIGITHPLQTKLKVRLAYNPSHMTTIGEHHLQDVFQELFGISFYGLLSHCRVTRVDICRNILDRRLEDYLYKGKWARLSQSFSKTGALQTINLGKAGNTQFTLYDKTEQLKKTGYNPIIRAEVKNFNAFPIAGLWSIKNPFNRLLIYSIDLYDPKLGEGHKRAFIDSCRLRGVPNALKCQPAADQKMFKKLLHEKLVPWWSITDEDWDWLWLDALDAVGLSNIPDSPVPFSEPALWKCT